MTEFEIFVVTFVSLNIIALVTYFALIYHFKKLHKQYKKMKGE